MDDDQKQPPAKKNCRGAEHMDVNRPKAVHPMLLRSLQKVRHLLSNDVKLKYGIESTNDESKQPHQKAMQPVDEPSPNPNGPNMMILIDDCLLELFAFLKPMDLANIALVNVRLNKLAKRYIQSKYKIRFAPNFQLIAHDCSVPINLDVFQAFLQIFGEDIVTLTLHKNIFDETYDKFESANVIQRFIQHYCHLEELTLIGFGMCGLINDFYTSLKSLTLDDCSVTRSWAKMKQLKTLKLNTLIFRRYPMEYISREMFSMYDYPYRPKPKPIPIPCNSFGGLEELRLIDVNLSNEDATKLIKSNQKLKRLSIVKCGEISTFIFEAVRNLNHLVEFEFKTQKGNNRGFTPLMLLKKLKVLKLCYVENSLPQSAFRSFPKGVDSENLRRIHERQNATSTFLDNLIQNEIKLDHFELGLCSFTDDTAVAIAKMATIKILKLNSVNGLNESHIVTIAKQLKLLVELRVKMKATISQNGIKEIVRAANRLKCLNLDTSGLVIDIETYQTLLATVKKREVHNKLELTIYGNGKQLAVPNEMLNEKNEEWLTVKELNRAQHSMFEDLNSKIGQPPPINYYSSGDSDDSDYY